MGRVILVKSPTYATPTGGAPTGAADEFDDVTVTPNAMISAYRRLRSGYGGSAYRVRRVSDNAEQDIGFDGDGLVDTAALTSFVGGSDGRIVTWYDQSGNGRNFGTAGASLQPFVVTAGTLHTNLNGLPTVYFPTGPYVRGTAGSTLITSTAYTHLAVARPTVAPNNSLPYQNNQLWQIQTRVGLAFKGTPVVQMHHYTSSHTSADVASEAVAMNCVAGARFDGANVEPFFNGAEGTPLAATSIGSYTDTNLIEIGVTFGNNYTGYMTEFAVWNTAISNDNINWAGASMAAVAGRTWTTVS